MDKLALKRTLADYCASRDRAVQYIETAYEYIRMSTEQIASCHVLGFPYDGQPRNSLQETIRDIDARLWQAAMDLTGMRQMLDAQAMKEFHDSIQKDTPPFVEENVRAHFLTAMQDADTFFRRGLVNVFRRLDPKAYKRNSAFKISPHIVINYWFDNWRGTLSVRYGAMDAINDVDRVFATLDRKKHVPRRLESGLNGAMQNGGNLYEDEYFRIRGFKNGNAHVKFLRADLLEKANRMIAEHYGEALAHG